MRRAAMLLLRSTGTRRALTLRASALAGAATVISLNTAELTNAESAAATRSPQDRPLISAVEQEDMGAALSDKLRSVPPFLPGIICDAVGAKIVAALVQTLEEVPLDAATRSAIRHAAALHSSGVDDAALERLTREVSSRVDIPLLSKEQERQLIAQAIALGIGDTTLASLATERVATVHRSFGRLLLDPAARRALATRVNAAVDVPGLGEAQEQALFERALDLVGGAIDKLVPAEWRALLDGLDAAELAALKAATTARLLERDALLGRLPAPMHDAARPLVAAAVEQLFEALLQTGVGAAALAPHERLQRLRAAEAALRAELAAAERRARRERTAAERRLKALEAQKDAAKREARAWRSRGA